MDKSIVAKTLKICIILLFCVLGFFFIRFTFSILLPIAIVFLLASTIEPIVHFLNHKCKLPRFIAVFMILLGVLAIIIGIIVLTFTEIYEGVKYLSEHLPEQLKQLGMILEQYFSTYIYPIYERILAFINSFTTENHLTYLQDYIQQPFQNFAQWIGTLLQQLLFAIPQNVTVLSEFITVLFFILLASFLLSIDYPRVKQFIQEIIPKKLYEKIDEITYHLKKTTTGYFKAQFILVCITFMIILIGLLMIGVPHALTIALFMLIIDLIPYLGTGLFFIPWICYAFLSGNYFLTIGLAIIYISVILTRQLLEPKILAVNMSIHPLVWVITAFIGLKIWGLSGLLFSPLLLVLFKGLQNAGIFRYLYHFVNKN